MKSCMNVNMKNENSGAMRYAKGYYAMITRSQQTVK